MKKTLYVKFNATRNKKYQTKSEIVEIDGRKEVIKSPLTKEAKAFIDSFPEKYMGTSSIFKNIEALPVEMYDGKAHYPVITGKSLDSVLKEHLDDKASFFDEIHRIFEKYYETSDGVRQKFCPDENWHEIFGDEFDEKINDECIRPANLDVIFDNVVIDSEGKAIVFDYEWTFDISCPVFYLKFRILSHIYDKYFSTISEWIDFKDFAKEFSLSDEDFALSLEMEKAFMCHIYKDGERALADKELFQKSITLNEIKDSFVLSEIELPKARQLFTDTLSNLNNAAVEMERKQAEINFMTNSKSWKITKPLRTFTNALRKIKHRFKDQGIIHGTVNYISRKSLENRGFDLSRPEEELIRERAYKFIRPVKISILTPLFNTPVAFLKEMIESVLSQTYSNFELVLIDFSPKENLEVENAVKSYDDRRIIYERSDQNIGIAENTNYCASKATGEYFAILDHDDVLHESALFEVMKEIEKGADFIYTDEIKFSESIEHPYEPNYKPDFSYEQLQTQNFICHFNCYSREIFNEVGGYRSGFNGSQDHDIVLRLTEKAKKISHIPMILYYWRVHENSVASSIDAKPYATISGIKAIDESYEREGLPFKVKSTVGNISRYRIIVPDFIEGDVAILLWGDRERDYFIRTINSLSKVIDRKCTLFLPDDIGLNENGIDKEKFNVKFIESRLLRANALPDDYLKLITEKYSMDFVWTVYAGLEISGEKCLSEYLSLLSSMNVRAVDSLVLMKKGNEEKIFSAGAYFTGDISKPVSLRGQGRDKSYEGFQADFTHVRAVSYVSNILTMYRRKFIFENEKIYLWTPFVNGISDEDALKKIDILRGNSIDEKIDPYFSNEVMKNYLE